MKKTYVWKHTFDNITFEKFNVNLFADNWTKNLIEGKIFNENIEISFYYENYKLSYYIYNKENEDYYDEYQFLTDNKTKDLNGNHKLIIRHFLEMDDDGQMVVDYTALHNIVGGSYE